MATRLDRRELVAGGALGVLFGVSAASGWAQAPMRDMDPGKVYLYKKTPQGELNLHFYFPPEWKATDRRPAIVFFFGGGWQNGSFTQFVGQSKYLASRGMVAASAEYRIKSKHGTAPDACVEDAKSAIRWIRAHAAELGVDPRRIAAGGGSAGGHLAACTALVSGFEAADEDGSVSSKPNALVLFNPALNVAGIPTVVERFSGTEAEKQELARRISPTPFLKKDSPPAVIFFGTDDKMIDQGTEYIKKAYELGNRAELYSAAGQPHGFFNRPPWHDVTLVEADRFLTSLGYLSGHPTLKLPADAPTLKRESP